MLAIHDRKTSFSDKWIEYCRINGVPYRIVDCYGSGIIKQIEDCSGLMWHWSHSDYKASLFARQLAASLELSGKKIFPDFNTCWHFDDKIGQKYLLEAVGAPLVSSHIFYDKEEALIWAGRTNYPKVFKLRGGAGSENVILVKGVSDANRLIKKAFGEGFKLKNRYNFLKERLWHLRRDKNLFAFLNISKGLARLLIPSKTELKFNRERNYIYFQDFVPGNDHDIRVIVIGKRAFAIKRIVRKDDFRASGSGHIIYDPDQIPKECIQISFDVSNRLGAQCLAYDFVFSDYKPYLIEISYSFSRDGYLPCPGYWDENLAWSEGRFTPEYFMIEDFLRDVDGR